MKTCPTCNQTYPDDAPAFCPKDGTRLASDASTYNSQPTMVSPAYRNAPQPYSPQQYAPQQQWAQAPARQGRKAAVIIAVVIGVLLVAGISVYFLTRSSSPLSSSSSNSNSSSSTATTNSTTATSTANNSTQSPSPSKTLKAYYDALKRGDVDALKQTISESSFQKLPAEGKAIAAQPDIEREVLSEKIDGDTATVFMRARRSGYDEWQEGTMPLVKENGQWKVALDKHIEELNKDVNQSSSSSGEVRTIREITDSNVPSPPLPGAIPPGNTNANTNSSNTSSSSQAPISGGVMNGKAISLPKPQYPAIAKASHASGTVTVQILIDESGKVISAHAIGGHPLLQKAAVDAAYQARFSPTMLSGKPVKVTGVVTYNFVAE